ncbi:MAG: hypothetical protein DCC46_11075 [Armatimonadetes bacterium]|nr:MAG: hypothetical protein DCC46_11075 [Armatimonadota bacterium]
MTIPPRRRPFHCYKAPASQTPPTFCHHACTGTGYPLQSERPIVPAKAAPKLKKRKLEMHSSWPKIASRQFANARLPNDRRYEVNEPT